MPDSIKKFKDSTHIVFTNAHDGEGTFICHSLLDGIHCDSFAFMHSNDIPAGVSLGQHQHSDTEEIYHLVSGKGILTFDGIEYEMQAGDTSLCGKGHSHGFLATENSVLIVIGSPTLR